ncbi:hypothetical protein [uncultured Methanobrevibacter sp.]|uniref:hypothetical protein n=1 Tax=uncultured Methanobrevibacter sp. TaxID=253161 RepID=UPI0025D4A80F|nr:hypothetical protein [uncultured Methanobrevibacter sp.]
MDDNITMQNMKTAYQIIEDGIRDLDNKSFQMISILGIMMTVQVTVLPNTVTAIGAVFLLFSLISYFISALLFIKSCIIKEYKIYPTNESVCYHYEYDVSLDDYVSGAVGDYDEAIEYNRRIIHEKGVDSRYAFYFFILGLFLTILTVGSIVIA